MGSTRKLTKAEIIQIIIACTERLNPYDKTPCAGSLYNHRLMRLRRAELFDMAKAEMQKWEERKIVMYFRLSTHSYALEFEPDATMGDIVSFCCCPERDGEINGIPTSDIDPLETIKGFCDKHITRGHPHFQSRKWLEYVESFNAGPTAHLKKKG